MMNCDATNEQMSEALDGQLDATRQAAFDVHLVRCPACAEGYAALREAVGLIRELESVAPPANLLAGIHAAIDRESGMRVRWNLFNTPPLRVALAASVVVAVGLLGIQYLDPAPKERAATMALQDAESSSGSRALAPSIGEDAPRMAGERPREPQRAVAEPARLEDDRLLVAEADMPLMEGSRPREPQRTASETARSEDDRMAVTEAEELVDREAVAKGGAKKMERLRPVAAVPMPEPAAAPPSPPVSAPASSVVAKRASRADAVAMDAVDHDKALWSEPAPAGIVRGLSAGDDAGHAPRVADELQAVLPTDSPANERRTRSQVDTVARQKKTEASPLLRISVAGLSRETVVQLANESALRKDRAVTKEELKLAFADSLAATAAPAQALDAVGGGREAAAQDPTETIIFHLPRTQLAAFLQELGALDRNMKALMPPAGGDMDDSVEIQIQLNP